MKYFQKLKTSEKISFSFSLFGFFSLLIFLILINITYFFIWYADQKEKSFSSMNKTYLGYLTSEGKMEDVEIFKEYLLTKDTIIIGDNGDLICSPGVSKKIHEAPERIKDKYFYKDGEIIYFIYTKYFEHIGEVKVFFDTTPYITSQIIIIKIGLLFIILVSTAQFFSGRYISKKLLKDLKNIANKLQRVDIHEKNKHIVCNMPENDEIRILADALNNSYDMIEAQTQKLKQFVTDVSHEFKTPLMAISSELDLFEKKKQKQKISSHDIEKLALNTRSSITKLNTLLETLFFLSRLEENAGCLITSNISFKKYIEKKLNEFKEIFPDKEIGYDINIPEGLSYKVEENTFSILIDNLVSNAIKFSPKNVELTIVGKKNYFSISDNGPGITPRERQKIWSKFYRKDTNIEGFGIGLYLVKRIIDMYGWNIDIKKKQKKGAEFTIYM